jgi:hypothetical protein
MRHIENMRGSGTVAAPNGESQSVSYNLDAYQNEIPVGSHETIPGMKQITGRINPVCFFGQNGVVLQMQDGRKMKFFFKDMTGAIGFSGWVD